LNKYVKINFGLNVFQYSLSFKRVITRCDISPPGVIISLEKALELEAWNHAKGR